MKRDKLISLVAACSPTCCFLSIQVHHHQQPTSSPSPSSPPPLRLDVYISPASSSPAPPHRTLLPSSSFFLPPSPPSSQQSSSCELFELLNTSHQSSSSQQSSSAAHQPINVSRGSIGRIWWTWRTRETRAARRRWWPASSGAGRGRWRRTSCWSTTSPRTARDAGTRSPDQQVGYIHIYIYVAQIISYMMLIEAAASL